MRIYTRAELGSRPFRTPPATVPLSRRAEVTIHYYGAGTPPRELRAFRKAIEHIHMDQRGWRGVGYNYVVDANGLIGEGAGRDVVGAHSPPHNWDGLGIIVWTENGVPTDAAMVGARRLYDELCRQAGRRLEIGWHGRDFATECPGPHLRKWAQAGMPVSTPPASPGTGAPSEGLFGMSDFKLWQGRTAVAPASGAWVTVVLDDKGGISLNTEPGQVLAIATIDADIPKGCTLQARFYEVDYKKGEKTVRVTKPMVAQELLPTSGKTFGPVVFLENVRAKKKGWSRRVRLEIKATGGKKIPVKANLRILKD